MIDLLQKFWKWANISPEQYAHKNSLTIINEFDYPYFDELLKYAKDTINNEVCSRQEIENVLMIMALDNETEDVLDYLAEKCSDEMIMQYIDLGVASIQPNVRWQIGELLFRRKPLNYLSYIERLSKDEDVYVRKRAHNLLQYIDQRRS